MEDICILLGLVQHHYAGAAWRPANGIHFDIHNALVLQDMMHPDPSKRPTAHKLAHSTLSSPHFTDGKENSCSHGNAVGKGQITQLVGNGQGSMFGKKTGSAGSKDGKRKVESKGARSAASGPSLTSFLKTTF